MKVEFAPKKIFRVVLDCDVYVLSSDNERVGKVCMLSLVRALHQMSGKPLVYIVGQNESHIGILSSSSRQTLCFDPRSFSRSR